MPETGVNSSTGSAADTPPAAAGTSAGAPPTAGTDLHLDLTGPGSSRARLMRALREAIRSGRLAPDTRLPAYRALAIDLGIARNTVQAAYAELVEEGWLTARQGSGTRVARRATPLDPGQARGPARPTRRRITHDLLPTSPDAASFPRTDWTASARRALAAAPNDAFGVADPRGRQELRQALAEYLGRARGVRTDPDRIVVCAGFAHGLRLLCQVLPGPLAVEAYGLAYHRSLIAGAGLDTIPLTVDAHGARTAELAASGAGAVLLTAAHQFPTGGPLHPERRTAAIDWARTTGGLVLEDDYDGEFRYDREPVGALQGLDPDRVVYSAPPARASPRRCAWAGWCCPATSPTASRKPRVSARCGPAWWTSSPSPTFSTPVQRPPSATYAPDLPLPPRPPHRDPRRARTAQNVTGIAAGLHAVLEPAKAPRK